MNLIYCQEALNAFALEVQKFGTIEAGGVLLGYNNGKDIIITKAIDGGPNAIHENFYFRADNNYIEMMIDMEFANSGGKVGYIGEWHTHPQVNPEPSEIDLNSLKEIADSANDLSLLLIIGAIGFNIKKFLYQSISILKSPEDSRFYVIEPKFC